MLDSCQTAHERTITDNLIRPILRGRDIRKYGFQFSNKWIIATFPSRKYNIDDYPSIKKFLTGFKPKLVQTGEALANIEKEQVVFHAQKYGISVNENDIKYSRKRTNNKWFETQDSVGYWEDFFKQKIMYPNMTKFLPFYLDDKGFLQNDKSFLITGENLAYLTCFLNSSIFKYCFTDYFPELQGGTRELRKVFMENIPVLRVSIDTNNIFQELLFRIQERKLLCLPTHDLEKDIDHLLFDLYGLSERERQTIGFIEIE